MPTPIIYFNSYDDEYSWLSNFSPHPVKDFPTAEHAYQAAKSTSPEEWEKMKRCVSPAQAKKFSYAMKHLRTDWDTVKVQIMQKALRIKFEQSPELKQKLLDTGDAELVHYAPWGDTYWGVDANKQYGENMQGKLLMQLREEFRE